MAGALAVTVFTGADLAAMGLDGAALTGVLPFAAGLAGAFALLAPVDLPVPGPLGLEVFFAKGESPESARVKRRPREATYTLTKGCQP